MPLPHSVAENLKSSSDWQAVQAHIMDCIEELDSIHDVNFMDPQSAAIHGQGKQEAKKMLIKILEPFIYPQPDLSNKKEATKLRTGLNM
jgi:hypothetical protein